MSEFGKTLEARVFVPVFARAMFRGFGSAVKTSSSSMHGSASVVLAMVNRSLLAVTGAKRSTFQRG